MKREFSRNFVKNAKISNARKLPRDGAELFHAQGRTDGHYEANRRISQF
jgi:hypothetical protein